MILYHYTLSKSKILLSILLLSFSSLLFSQANIRFQKSIRGGVTFASNCLQLTAGTFTNTAGGTTMSASSDLILPPGSTILKAILFVEEDEITPALTSLKFKIGTNPYITLNTTSPGFLGNTTTGESQFFIDVTNLIPSDEYKTNYVQNGQFNTKGNFAVADVTPAVVNNQGFGWALIVAYSNPNSPLRNVTIADINTAYGLGTTGTVSIPNIIVPTVGVINASVISTSTWGEEGLADNISFGVQGNVTRLRDPIYGNTTDVSNSTISMAATNNVSTDGGPAIAGNYEARNPYNGFGQVYADDYDCDIFNANGILPNSATPITARIEQRGSLTEAIAGSAFAVSIDIAAAELTKSLSPTTISSGGTATYTFTIDNTVTGAVTQNNISFTDNLPPGIQIANPSNATITGGTGGNVTAAPGSQVITLNNFSINGGQTATITVDVTNVPGMTNPDCSTNPSAFTNGPTNIVNNPDNLANGVQDVCLVVLGTPTADYTATTVCEGDPTIFTDASVAVGSNTLTSWSWDFGDGNTSSAQNPSHTYTSAGTYSVTLLVTSSDGKTDSETKTVTVNPLPTPIVSADVSICEGNNTQLSASGGTTYSWSPSTALSNAAIANPIASPTTTTTYTVTVTNANGCSDDASIKVTVEPLPGSAGTDASITICDDEPNFNMATKLGGSPATGGTWTNAAGTTVPNTFNPSSNPSGVYTYTQAGTLCPSNSATLDITVNPNADAGDGGDYIFCQSDGIINIPALNTGTPTAGGTWTDVNGAGMNASLDVNLENLTPGIYAFEYSITSAPPCTDAVATVTIEVFESPTLTYVSDVCDATNTSYTVTMTISGGDPNSYMINGSPASSPFTSAPQPNNSVYDFTVTDANGCAPLASQSNNITGQVKCNCSTDAGTMQLPTAPIKFCPTDEKTVNHNVNQNLDGNDVIMYVIHTGSGTSLGTVIDKFPYANIYNIKHDGTYPLTPNVIYYVSAVAGDPDGSGTMVDLTDPNGCMSVSKGVPIVFLEEPTLNFNLDKTDYCVAEQPIMTFTFAKGKAPYDVELSTTEVLTGLNNGNTHALTNAGLGAQSISAVRVTDANGCASTSNMPTANYNVVGAPVIDPNFTPTCNSTNTGYDIQFNVSGGNVASYDFSASSHVVNTISPGTYSVTGLGNGVAFTIKVEDSFQCAQASFSSAHTCPCATQVGDMLPLGTTAPIEYCFEEIVSLNYDPTGENLDGNDVVSYILYADPANPEASIIQIRNNPNFGVLSGILTTNTTYYIAAIAGDDDGAGVVDLTQGCRDISAAIPITILDIPTVSFTATPSSLCQGSPVTVNVTTTGNYDINYTFTVTPNSAAEGPYTLSTTAGNTETILMLAGQDPGNYTIAIDTINYPINTSKTPLACKAKWISNPFIATIEAAPKVALTSSNLDICPGESVVLTFTRLAGSNPDGITLTYTESATGTTGTVTFPVGTDIVTATVNPTAINSTYIVQSYLTTTNGCSGVVGSEQVNVDVMTLPTAVLAIDKTEICFGDVVNVSVNNITGNKPEYEATLTFPANQQTFTTSGGNFAGQNPLATLTGLAPGTYSVSLDKMQNVLLSASSGNRCPENPINSTLSFTVNELPDVDFNGIDRICFGEEDRLDITTTKGANPITVNYESNLGLNTTVNVNGTNAFKQVPTDTVTYKPLSVTDANGCVQTVFNTDHTVDVVALPIVDFDATERIKCPPLETILFNKSPNMRDNSDLLWEVEAVGTFDRIDSVNLSLEDQRTYDVRLTIKTEEGCTTTLLRQDFLTVNKLPIANFNFSPADPDVIENQVLLQNRSLNAKTVEWFIDSLPSTTQFSPSVYFPTDTGRFYNVTLYAYSEGLCVDSITKRIRVNDAFNVYIPNSFTPDGDGRNETFGPVHFGIDTKGYSFAIYNRWGERIFFTEEQGEFWDGKYQGEFVTSGVYVYQIIVRAGTNAEEKRYFGPVNVLR